MVVEDADEYKEKEKKVLTLQTVSVTVQMRADECVGARMHWRADALACRFVGMRMCWRADVLACGCVGEQTRMTVKKTKRIKKRKEKKTY